MIITTDNIDEITKALVESISKPIPIQIRAIKIVSEDIRPRDQILCIFV